MITNDTANDLTNFEGCLEQFIKLIPEENTRKMAKYALFPAGKRIRPRLIFAISHALSIPICHNIQSIAAAVEILHSSSLVHDDLPALDNDLERRGKPTAHIQYGEGEAVLLGDLLLNLAFFGLAKFVDQKILGAVISELASANTQLLLGQLKDIKNPENHEVLAEIHRQKTGALFSVSAYLPTILANNLEESERQIFKEFGLNYGLLFQYLNDLKEAPLIENEVRSLAANDDFSAVIQNNINSDHRNSDVKNGRLSRFGLKKAEFMMAIENCESKFDDILTIISKKQGGEDLMSSASVSNLQSILAESLVPAREFVV